MSSKAEPGQAASGYPELNAEETFLVILLLENIISYMKSILKKSIRYNTRNVDIVFYKNRIPKIQSILQSIREHNL